MGVIQDRVNKTSFPIVNVFNVQDLQAGMLFYHDSGIKIIINHHRATT